MFGTVCALANLKDHGPPSSAGGTLNASGNSAATTFNFASGAVGGTDTVNSKLAYQGFTSYVASNNGDTITLTATGQNATGGTGVDTFNAIGGNHTVSGGASVDTFNVTAGTVTISDLGNGGNDVLVVSTGATATTTLAAAWTASAASSNAGTASAPRLQRQRGGAPTGGWTLTNNTTTGITMTGSANNDIITGNTGNDTISGGALTPSTAAAAQIA